MTAVIAWCRPNFNANSLPNIIAGMARREKTILTTMGVNTYRRPFFMTTKVQNATSQVLQLAHLDNSTVEGLYKKHGPLALGSRTKLMQHWADRIDYWLGPKKVMPIKRGTQA
jgi:hypothetical protein